VFSLSFDCIFFAAIILWWIKIKNVYNRFEHCFQRACYHYDIMLSKHDVCFTVRLLVGWTVNRPLRLPLLIKCASFRDVVRGVKGFDVGGQEYRYNSIDVRPRGPRPDVSGHAHRCGTDFASNWLTSNRCLRDACAISRVPA